MDRTPLVPLWRIARLVPLATFLLAGSTRAADHVVTPGQSIQAAIQAASDGDRVLLQPGTYTEAIDLLGKDLAVIGVGGAAVTTIDASGLGTSVVTLASGEPATTLLRGLTLTGGVGQTFGTSFGGGGVLARNGAQATLRECRVVGNALAQAGYGAGVHASAGPGIGAPAHLTIEDSVIADNQGRGATGGLTLRRCSVLRNAGGVEGHGPLLMEDCLVAGNVTSESGGGIRSGFLNASLELRRCVFIGNEATRGGAIHYSKTVGIGSLQIAGCIFLRNEAISDGGAIDAYHDAENMFSGGIRLSRCIFSGNTAGGNGGAVSLDAEDFGVLVEHCTFGRNSSGIFAAGAGLAVRDSILRDANPITSSAPVTVTNCNVPPSFPAWPGGDNFTADPKFVDELKDDLRLRADSPCIGAAATNPFVSTDAEGDAVVGDADVGGDEFHPHLKVLGVPTPGNTVTFSVIGPPGAPFTMLFMGLSLAATPIHTPHGDLLLGDILTPFTIVLPALPASGYIGIPLTLAPTLPPANVYLQAFVASGPTSGTFTNVESVRID